jgi:O-antigen ligase
MLCLVVSVAAYAFMRATGSGRRQRLGGLAASVVVAALGWASPLSEVLLRRAAETPDRNAYSMRLVAMEEGIAMAVEHPWLGLGFNGFGAARRAVAEDWLTPNVASNGLSRTSNQYIQTATDGGVAAFLCLLVFAVFTIRNAVRVASWREASPSLIGSQAWLIGVLVGNQTALWMLGGTPTGFFLFAVAGVTAGATRLLPAATRRTL